MTTTHPAIAPAVDDLIKPPDCWGCCHWHGRAYLGIRWVCQPHPNGWPHSTGPCPHYTREP